MLMIAPIIAAHSGFDSIYTLFGYLDLQLNGTRNNLDLFGGPFSGVRRVLLPPAPLQDLKTGLPDPRDSLSGSHFSLPGPVTEQTGPITAGAMVMIGVQANSLVSDFYTGNLGGRLELDLQVAHPGGDLLLGLI